MHFYFCFGLGLMMLSFVDFGLCIKCHVCHSKGGSACLDPFRRFNESSTLRECQGKPGELPVLIEVVMQKLDVGMQTTRIRDNEVESSTEETRPVLVCQKIVAIVDGDLMTSRGCGPTHVNGMPSCEAVAMSAPKLQLKHCTTCLTDACNTAPTDVATSLLLLHAAVITTTSYRIFN